MKRSFIEILEGDREEITERIMIGESITSISRSYGCTCPSVRNFCKKYGIKYKSNRPENYGRADELRDDVIKLFNEGNSPSKIAKEFGLNRHTVQKWLDKWGVDFTRGKRERGSIDDYIKEIEGAFENGETINSIAGRLGFDSSYICKVLKDMGYDTNKNRCEYSVDEDFFKKIDSEEKAYCLGFLYADGCVADDGAIVFSQHSKDIDILYKIKDIIGYNGKIITKDNNVCCMVINRRKIANQLIELGCIPRKSKIIKFPSNDIVPEKFMCDFLRGVFDGDGSIKQNAQVATISTSSSYFIDGLKNHFSWLYYAVYKDKKWGCYSFALNRKAETKKFLNYIYRGGYSKIYLNRKFNIAKRVLDRFNQNGV